jgi:hypothetical protein
MNSYLGTGDAQNPYLDQLLGQDLEKQGGGGLLGKVGSIVGLVGLLSDERRKRNVRPGNLEASRAVGELDPYTYEYEAGLDPSGERRMGFMAQDLERVAPQAVIDTPAGKVVDTAQATGLALSHGAEVEQRLRGIEERLGSDTANALRDADRAHAARRQPQAQPQPQASQQRFAPGGLAGPIPYEDTRAQGRDATMAMFDRAQGQAQQMDRDAASLRSKESQPVDQATADRRRQQAMAVGAVPQQRELGANSLSQIDRNYGYREQPWSDSWEASPASAASSAMQRIQAIEKGLAAQPPAPQGRDPNWRFVVPAGQPQGLAAQPVDPMAAYDPTKSGYYQGYDGRIV